MTGLNITRNFSKENITPFDEIAWETRSTTITNDTGQPVFEQNNVEVPSFWSQLATKIVASKYFYGNVDGQNTRENSVKQLVHRVCRTIADWGLADGYFEDQKTANVFYDELCWLCVNQYGAFNSPVWFNVGIEHIYGVKGSPSNYRWDKEKSCAVPCEDTFTFPQVAACFLQSVEDNMESIMSLAVSEAMLFKSGSGSGTNLSTLRSNKELLSGGGKPSGPLSFMKVYDQIAAVIKSGGRRRRAAKMQVLSIDHPDIVDFINCKMTEEKKALALIKAGYKPDDAYAAVMYQNSNLSVRVSDAFMKAVEDDQDWQTKAVTTGEVVETFKAKDLLKLIAKATHSCGDPGMQYDDTCNAWNTVPNSGRINTTNPCNEISAPDNTACNLASLNLMKFGKWFNSETFSNAVRIFIIAQDILVDRGSYPTIKITENSHKLRALGLGFANLGALIMSGAFSYDSKPARQLAGDISSAMTRAAYLTSGEIASVLGPFEEYQKNKLEMEKVLQCHLIPNSTCHLTPDIPYMSYRNSQVTAIAPTGTIGFLMDCDTTGIEPDIALVKYKTLSDGGNLKLVNNTVKLALKNLHYPEGQISAIVAFIEKNDTIESCDLLKPEHLSVFDCAYRAKSGKRCIAYSAHLEMLAAVQPYISGAISKTISVPEETSVEEIMQIYIRAWKLGLKGVAIYRDGSKNMQPVSTSASNEVKRAPEKPAAARKRLPDTRQSITHKFSVAGHEGYLTVGLYEDGKPGELFITMAKEGSTIGGLMDAIGTCTSMALQHRVPLSDLVEKFRFTRFEPSGITGNREIPFCKSLIDYIFCWLGCQFIEGYADANTISGVHGDETEETPVTEKVYNVDAQFAHFGADAPACDVCGAITVRNGTCYKCFNCGNSMGCS
jgi:ribonucleoside-diphosphate reductase alpha chain